MRPIVPLVCLFLCLFDLASAHPRQSRVQLAENLLQADGAFKHPFSALELGEGHGGRLTKMMDAVCWTLSRSPLELSAAAVAWFGRGQPHDASIPTAASVPVLLAVSSETVPAATLALEIGGLVILVALVISFIVVISDFQTLRSAEPDVHKPPVMTSVAPPSSSSRAVPQQQWSQQPAGGRHYATTPLMPAIHAAYDPYDQNAQSLRSRPASIGVLPGPGMLSEGAPAMALGRPAAAKLELHANGGLQAAAASRAPLPRPMVPRTLVPVGVGQVSLSRESIGRLRSHRLPVPIAGPSGVGSIFFARLTDHSSAESATGMEPAAQDNLAVAVNGDNTASSVGSRSTDSGDIWLEITTTAKSSMPHASLGPLKFGTHGAVGHGHSLLPNAWQRHEPVAIYGPRPSSAGERQWSGSLEQVDTARWQVVLDGQPVFSIQDAASAIARNGSLGVFSEPFVLVAEHLADGYKVATARLRAQPPSLVVKVEPRGDVHLFLSAMLAILLLRPELLERASGGGNTSLWG
eukprot:TRINITY_DN53331_c0_g1_i1.p1 TRINITY_DN53331_c0_g1~~TRINITY_DN53331_c0_g1_i1.p1  ORF type:complete len:521 (-),score=68.91 TRINITY_DN53331_c0_g1_i1:182-1744(-)